ncbi:MAG: alpha-L-fucosidase [Planctomycetota bacterium]
MKHPQMVRSQFLIFFTLSFGLTIAGTALAQNFDEFEAKDFSKEIDQTVAQVQRLARTGAYQPNWESLEQYRIPEWYQDAKLGIFIHWGVYTVPEHGWEWYPRQMYIDKDNWRGNLFQYHRDTYGDQSEFGYKDLIPKFKAEKFDPEEWVTLFKQAGAKYVVPVAEHHDGFAMYDSDLTQWSSVKMGPKRDVVGELEKETRKQGLRFGVSSHRAFNWLYYVRKTEFDNADPRFKGLYGRPIPELFKDDAADYKKNWPPHDQKFKDEWLARTGELVSKYNPDLVWFDFGIANDRNRPPQENPFQDHLKSFASFYYNSAASRDVEPVINYKWSAFPERAAVLDLERSKLNDIRELYWQTDSSVAKNSWCYVDKLNYRTSDSLIDDLIDIVSKNGGLLLNVCPRADGSIPDEQKKLLKEIGQWLSINGEAIYGSRPFKTYGEGPTETVTGHLSENKNKPFGSKDFRFTTQDRGHTLYAFALKPTAGETIVITKLKKGNSLHLKPESVELLGSETKLSWEQTDSGLEVEFPQELPHSAAVVLKIK